ncbi:MAG: c-type cytochrome [Nitrospinota bacterium]
MTDDVKRTILGLTVKQWVVKTAGLVIGLIAVVNVTKSAGFPPIFTKLFSIYVIACYLFYILIDLPPMKPLTGFRAFLYLMITFFLFSAIYSGAGRSLPQFNPLNEIAKINKPPFKMGEAAGPELIAAGLEVFETNKCFNCHQAAGKGTSNRGPNFDLHQIGLLPKDDLMGDILDPRKEQAKGFEDPKSKKAMPTYYGEEISKDEMAALLAFLGTLWNKEKMPVRGKVEGTEPMLKWSEDPEIIAMGQQVFEGKMYEDLNCSACHGKDGVPLMDGARDLRNPESESKRPGREGEKLKDWTDADWFDSVSNGIEDTPMMPWLEEYPPRAIWLAIAYAQQFHKK